MNPPNDESGRALLIWAILATFVGAASSVVAVLLFLQLRSSARHDTAMQASRLLELREEAVVGSYRWIEGDADYGVITLLPDHTFISPGGDKARFHQWAIARDELLVVWLSGIDRFTNSEVPGVFLATRPDGKILRMERQR